MNKRMAGVIALSCVCGSATAGFGFEPVAALAPQAVAAEALEVGDVTGDGRDDVVVLAGGSHPFYAGKVLVYAQQDAGFGNPVAIDFESGSTALASVLGLADLDADGDLDIVVGHGGYYDDARIVVLRNDGGSFVASSVETSEPTVQLGFEDVDRDGHMDIVARRGYWSDTTILYGDGAMGFPEQTTLVTSGDGGPFHLVDIDGDGMRDFVYGRQGQIRVRAQDGTGFNGVDRVLLSMASRWTTPAPVLADFNGDGRPDIALSHYSNWGNPAIVVYLQDTHGRYRLKQAAGRSSQHFGGLYAGDIDGNGQADLLTHGASYRDAGLGLLLSQPGRFEPLQEFWSDDAATLRIGDLNDDGINDVAMHAAGGGVSYMLGRATAMEGDLAVFLGLAGSSAVVRVENRSGGLPTSAYQLSVRLHARFGAPVASQVPVGCDAYTWDDVLYMSCPMPALPAGGHQETVLRFGMGSAPARNTLQAHASIQPQVPDLRQDNNRVSKRVLVGPPAN